MKKFFKNNWIYILASMVVLALFSLRFYHLTILPVFADEAIYIRWAQVMKAVETLRFLPLSDGKQPLYMWVVIPFLKFISDPLVAGRFVSILSGLGSLIGISILSYLLFKSKKVALIAGLIFAVSPFVFFFNRLALVDSMLAMFGIWTFILSYIAVTKERLDFAMLAGFALGGAWLTKSPALFFALMLPTLWLFIKSPSGPEALRAGGLIHFLKIFGLTIVTVIIGYGMYNILRLGPNWSMIASRNLDYVYPFSHLLTSPFDPLKPFLLQAWQWIVMMGPWLLMVFGLIGYLVNWKKHWKATIVLTVWFLAPIFAQAEFAKVFTARYILFTIPFLIVIASSAFLETKKTFSKILLLGLAIFITQSLIFDYRLLISPEKANLPRSERSGYLEEWTAGQGIYEISQYLKNEQKTNPNEKIIVGTEGYFGTLPDALQAYMNDTPSITVIGIGLTFDGLPSQLANAKKAGDKIYLIVNKSRFGHEPAKDGLKIVGEYPKGVRPDGSRDSLLFMSSI